LLKRTAFAGTDWKQTYKELYYQRGKTPVALQQGKLIHSNRTYITYATCSR